MVIYALQATVGPWFAALPSYAERVSQKLQNMRDSFAVFGMLQRKMSEALAPASAPPASQVQMESNGILDLLLPATGYSLSIVATIALTMVVAAFLLASSDRLYDQIVRSFPTLSGKKKALRMLHDVEKSISTYVLATTSINAVLGTAVGVSFYLLGMPTPILWAFLVFAFNFIPYIGAVTGIALSGIVAIATFDSLAAALVPPLVYAALNGIENQVASPLFLGRNLELNALAILVSFAFWTWLWGIGGSLIAIPSLLIVKIISDHTEGLSGLSELIGYTQPGNAENGNEGSPKVEERVVGNRAGSLL